MKKALLAVSFGTTVPRAVAAIAALEKRFQEAAPDRYFYRAFTSPTIRRVLAERGEEVLSVEEALERMTEEGCGDVAVQPSYVLCGGEYSRLLETAARHRQKAPDCALRVGRPLLSSPADLRRAAEILWTAYRPAEGALALFGHGTDHLADMAYPALQTALRLAGIGNAYVATVEGWPAFGDLLAQLREENFRRVTLAPLMLVAGDHALKDMAGDGPESWRSRLLAEGFEVECHLRGLGELEEIRELYTQHLREIL